MSPSVDRNNKSADLPISEGDQVSWAWGGSHPSGEVAKIVEEGSAKVTSNKGNTITRNAKPGDPAIKISRKGNDVVKLAHELDQVKEANA